MSIKLYLTFKGSPKWNTFINRVSIWDSLLRNSRKGYCAWVIELASELTVRSVKEPSMPSALFSGRCLSGMKAVDLMHLKKHVRTALWKRERKRERKGKGKGKHQSSVAGLGKLITLFLPETLGVVVKNLNKTCCVSSLLLVMFCGHHHFSPSGNSICPYCAKVMDWRILVAIRAMPLKQRVSALAQKGINPVCRLTKWWLIHLKGMTRVPILGFHLDNQKPPFSQTRTSLMNIQRKVLLHCQL